MTFHFKPNLIIRDWDEPLKIVVRKVLYLPDGTPILSNPLPGLSPHQPMRPYRSGTVSQVISTAGVYQVTLPSHWKVSCTFRIWGAGGGGGGAALRGGSSVPMPTPGGGGGNTQIDGLLFAGGGGGGGATNVDNFFPQTGGGGAGGSASGGNQANTSGQTGSSGYQNSGGYSFPAGGAGINDGVHAAGAGGNGAVLYVSNTGRYHAGGGAGSGGYARWSSSPVEFLLGGATITVRVGGGGGPGSTPAGFVHTSPQPGNPGLFRMDVQ